MLLYKQRAIAGTIMAVCMLCVACSDCANRVIAEVTSPGRTARAVIFERSCGATTGLSMQVSLLRASTTLPRGKGNVFIADDDHGSVPVNAGGMIDVKVFWVSEREMLIRYPARARVFLRRTEHDGVRVTYEPVPPIGPNADRTGRFYDARLSGTSATR